MILSSFSIVSRETHLDYKRLTAIAPEAGAAAFGHVHVVF